MAKNAKKKAKRKGTGDRGLGTGDGSNLPPVEGGLTCNLAGADLLRVYGEHKVLEERGMTLLDAQEAIKQARADWTEAFDRLNRLLIECDEARGDEVIAARSDCKARGKVIEKAAEEVKLAKAGVAESWGVINGLIDESTEGLPMFQ